jgi:hypothetical protein
MSNHGFALLRSARRLACALLVLAPISGARLARAESSSAESGCPVVSPDGDGDGIADSDDACPKEAGVSSQEPKQNGCPEKFASADAGAAEVSFTGFRSLGDGRSVVYVELSGMIAVEVRKVHGAVVYTLKDTKVPLRTNRYPLVTSEFPSALASVALVADKADKKAKSARLVLKLRSDVEPEHRLVKQGAGAVLEIELPAASDGCTLPLKKAR